MFIYLGQLLLLWLSCYRRHVYQMTLHKFGSLLHGLVDALMHQLQAIAQLVEAAQGAAFLGELKKQWKRHNKAIKSIRDIFMVRLGSAQSLQEAVSVGRRCTALYS